MASTRAALVIRPLEPADLEQWLELVNQFQYWQDDVEALRFDDTLRPAGEPVLRLDLTSRVHSGTEQPD